MMQKALLEHGRSSFFLRAVRFWHLSCFQYSFQTSIRRRCSSLKNRRAVPTVPSSRNVSGDSTDLDAFQLEVAAAAVAAASALASATSAGGHQLATAGTSRPGNTDWNTPGLDNGNRN